MKVFSFLIGLMLIGIFSACGNSKNYTYEYTYNHCDTQQHSFDSKDAYCTGLRDDELNHYCASELREEAFKNDCEG